MRYWQIENEVTLPAYWAGTPDDFVMVMKTAYRVIKEVSPESQVLLAGFPGFAITFADATDPSDPRSRVADLGREQLALYTFILERTRGYFDILDTHLYQDPESIPRKVQWYRDQMRAFGYERPIWATEVGGPHTGPGGDRRYLRASPPADAQPAEVVKRYVLAFSAGVERAFWFNLSQRPSDAGIATLGPSFGQMPLISGTETEMGGTRRPAFATYQLTVRKLRGFTAVQRLDLGEGVVAFRVVKPSIDLYVFWAADGERFVDVPVTTRVAVTDVHGGVREAEPSRLRVDATPIFVEPLRPGRP